MNTITKNIQTDKSYTCEIKSIPNITTDKWYIKEINCANTNFKFNVGVDGKSFSYTCSRVKDGTVINNTEVDLTISFTNTVGPTRSDKIVQTFWDFNISSPKVPFIIKNTIEDKEITISITKAGSITLDCMYYIGDISDDIPDTSLYQNFTDSKDFIIPKGQALYLYTDIMNGIYNGVYNYIRFDSVGRFGISGNIMALIKEYNFTNSSYTFNSMFYNCTGLTYIESGVFPYNVIYGAYNNMFYGCTGLTSLPNNLLPATTLAQYCYYNMFGGCTSLTTAPELPATSLAQYCYSNMFAGCTSLTTAPELPATTLATNCYNAMFAGCTSLTTAPELPATTLATKCYYSMFSRCTQLNYIKAMFTTTPNAEYTGNWVENVASSGTFVKNANATWDVTGNNGIPEGWTVVTATE